VSHIENEFDVAFETSGHDRNVGFALRALKSQGQLVLYGVFQKKYSVDLNQISEFKELTIFGGHLADDLAFDKSVKFLGEHQKNLRFLISNVVSFENFTLAFSSKKFKQFKTLFQPTNLNGVN
jgi:threonine dehydrogenase-like Zn-dependent dehydrogenase